MTDTPATPARPSSPDPISLTARRPEDLLAALPVLLGFWPEEDVVMLTFGASHPFHARVDLPPLAVQDGGVLAALGDLLLGPARQHGVRDVVLVYHTADPTAADRVHAALEDACRASGIRVLVGLVADGHRVRPAGEPGPGTPYDVSCHPFIVEAIVSGRLAHRSREDLVASVEADRDQVRRVVHALLRDGVTGDGLALDGLALDGLALDGLPLDGRTIHEQGCWVRARVTEGLAGDVPSDEVVARMLWVLQAPRVRDAALALIGRRSAPAHAEFWTGVVRRSPEELVAAPAVLLGWAAWQAGDGARAWVAVDRCRRAEPDHPLAAHLADLLERAVPPDFWDEDFDWTLGLPATG